MIPERHWNYRVIEYADGDGFGLHEVHYVKGEVDSWTEKPIVVGTSLEGINQQLSQMRVDARRRGVLQESAVAKEMKEGKMICECGHEKANHGRGETCYGSKNQCLCTGYKPATLEMKEGNKS